MGHDMERRLIEGLAVEVRAEGGVTLRGHAAVFEQLSENLGGFREKIRAGAFAESIRRDDIRALWNHDPNVVLGRNRAGTLRLKEDDVGLAVAIDLPDTAPARDMAHSIERGDVTQMSFGFSVKPDGQDWAEDDDGMVIRTLTAVRLFDVSPVTFPAYPQTDIAVRALESWRDGLAQASELAAMRARDRLRRRQQLAELEF